ncbi:MAG: U32 family peptidase, partial [Lachnospiraceae bacterium]|nr:U32 family peptidase [Lachnospiraceae bacterium]
MRNVEILAPAGSLDGLYASLLMGADAVYVGTCKFGARAYADNPSVEELAEALTYAHLRKKKIYLTVNTLLKDRELEEELFPMIRPLYEAGLDACIVQDMGVLSFLHENFPEMDLHASTQMTLFSGEEADILKPFGVTRYVPARELTIEEIREARSQTDMEIEVFVHGALCYC